MCLQALMTSRRVPDEIICVDDASTDDTWSILQEAKERYPQIRTLRLPVRKGPAAARNAGAAATEGEWLFFTDSDCTVEPETLSHLLRAARSSRDVAAVIGLYRPEASSGGALSAFVAAYSASTHSSGTGASLSTQCALVSRQAFVACGGFDETYATATVEDLQLGYELKRRGYALLLEPKARVAHHHVYTWGGFWRNYFSKSRAFVGAVGTSGARWGQGYLHWKQPLSVVCTVMIWIALATSPLLPWALTAVPALLGVEAISHRRLLTYEPRGSAAGLVRLLLLQPAMLAVAFGTAVGLARRLTSDTGGTNPWTR
jgi:GT2 family glycosyltransferase